MAEGGVNQLKEQIEVNQTTVEASIQIMENKNDQLCKRQDKLMSKFDAIYAIFHGCFTSKLNFTLRKKLDPTGESSSNASPFTI